MNWVDVLVILLAISIAVIGAKQGLVVTVPAIVLLLTGAVAGIKLAPLIVSDMQSNPVRAGLSVGIPVLLAALGETFGVYLGRLLKVRVTNRYLSGVDNTLGAILQAAVVLVVSWFVLLSLTGMPGMPGLVASINGSSVLGEVNSVMPDAARELPNELRRQLNFPNFPAASNPFTTTPIGEVGPPNTALQKSSIVREVHPSVLKIRGQAPSCSRALEGSGFVVAPHRVMTNAHVVAGTTTVMVQTAQKTDLSAHVVYYDSQTDVAILDVPSLHEPALDFSPSTAHTDQDAIVLGYPLDGPYTASAAKIRDEIPLRGPNIYTSATVQRDVYTVRAQVRSGNSGGPLIATDGHVLGVVFGAAVDDSDTGFALTRAQVAGALAAAGRTQEVSTGACVT